MAVLHKNELPISLELVRSLVSDQFPQYTELPVTPLGATGSTNRLFRLGTELLVRLPRQPDSGKGVMKEARWIPALSGQLPLKTPEILHLGKPDASYPEVWAITRWLNGELPRVWQPGDPENRDGKQLAEDLAAFIRALQHIEVTAEAKADESLRWYRGLALIEYDLTFRRTLEFCRSQDDIDLDFEAIEAVWTNSLRLPEARTAAPDRWYHSDLVAENLLLQDSRLTAVLDFGGLAIGDPTIDLHGAWELFDPSARSTFRTALGAGDGQWLVGRAWALAIGLGALSYYWRTMPGRCRDRLAMIRAVLADARED